MTRHQTKHFAVQLLRRAVQLGVLGIMVLVVYISLYAHYRAARATDDDQLMSGFNGAVLSQIDGYASSLEDPQAFLDGYKGTIWSMRLAGWDLTDPLAAAETIAASRTIHWPLIISILIPIIATLLLGRVFCSWICPAGLLFEFTDKLRRLLRIAEIKPSDVQFSRANKYVLLAMGLLFALVLGLPFFARIYPPAMMSRLAHSWVFGTAITGVLITLGVMVVFEVGITRRWWCRTMCPGGALYGLLGWSRLVRVKLDAARCTGCRDCEPVCPMGLYPVRESYGIECDNCGVCLKHCPDDALLYSVGLPGRERTFVKQSTSNNQAARTPRTVGVLSKAMLIIIAAAAMLSVPGSAEGHHILGLPHYSYSENYPQVPTLEYPATTGPYDVLLTSYPGHPIPTEPTNVAFYIKNRNTGEPYAQTISVRILQTYTFGRNRVVLPATELTSFDKTHKISAVFPEEGEFIIELTLDVEGQPEVIPFLVIAGDPTATASILTTIGIGLAVFIVIVRAIKIKQKRRATATPGYSDGALPMPA